MARRTACGEFGVAWRLGVLALTLFLLGGEAQAACDPSQSCCSSAPSTGSPCGGAGVATLGNASGVDSGAGNPINLLGGNKFQREVDMPALPGVLGLELVRYYNSADAERHLLGRGWRLSYETSLRVGTGALAGAVEIVQADGTRIAFASPPDQRQGQGQGDLYRALNPLQGLVRRLDTPRGKEYLWLWADGRQLRFNTKGQLEQIRVPSGEFLSLRYDGRGWLMNVIDPAGRRLSVNVLDKASAQAPGRYRGIQSIDTPVGRFRYEHGGALPEGSSAKPDELIANLSQVIYPAQAPSEGGTAPEVRSRRYHHEDPRSPTLLTGISEQRLSRDGQTSHQRLSTWAYDEQGRAVLSFKGERPSGATGGVGLEQVSLQRGPTKHGQSTTVLTNSLGQTTVYTSTTIAGEPRLLQALGPGCSSCGPSNVRYGYDRVGRLTEETRLDEKGQPLRSTRTELDRYCRPVKVSTVTYRNSKAQPAQTRVRYEYAAMDVSDPYALPSPQPVLIAAPSVVPGKERFTRITYNAAMQPLSVSEEGFSPVDEQGRFVPQGTAIRRVTTYGYTQINGRSVLASLDGPLPNGSNGSPEDSDVTRYGWDARADYLQRIVRPGQRAIGVQREPDSGRIVGVTGPDGLNRPLPQPARGNVGLSNNADLNGNADLNADLRIEHDPWSRPVAWRSAAGDDSEALLSATWGPAGSVAESSVLGFATPSAQVQRRLDDFARVVAIRNPGQDWQFARYDEAGRITQTIDPRGARQSAHWDLAGRLIRLERFAPGAEAGATAEQVIERRHEHERLVEERISDKNGQRITRLSYDARGALASETLRIEPAAALRAALPEPLQLSLAYRHGEDGRLTRTLTGAGGRSLSIVQEDVAGQVSRISTEGVLPAWFGGGRNIARDIRWQHLGALSYATAITHGDGSVDHFEPVSAQALNGSARTVLIAGESALSIAPPGQGQGNAGLPSSVITSQGTQRLSWNAAAQLERTERADGGRSDYLYDARGRRVIKLVIEASGQTRVSLSLYEDSRLVAEADAQGRLSYAYAHLGYRPVAQIPLQPASVWQRFKTWHVGPEARHLHTARAGRVLSVSERGQTVWRDQEPGDEPAPGIHQPLRYVGQYHDDDSGLSYHGARFFEPTQGRFISPDPAGVADAVNDLPAGLLLDLYAYAGGRPDAYFDPDGAALIAIPEFTINNMSDDDATALIASYIQADREQVFGASCPVRAALLPPIRFADEELPIDVTQAKYRNPSNTEQVWASSQRIVQCGEKAKDDVVERRIQKYNFGFMLLESNPPQIYMDCSKDGCPGRSLRGTVLNDYVASYGQTQFIGTTMVEKLLDLKSGALTATQEERLVLRLDDAVLWRAASAPLQQAKYIGMRFDKWPLAQPAWNEASKDMQDEFMQKTGFDRVGGKKLWDGMNSWRQNPSPRLNGEARAAFGTAVIMRDPSVRDYLMGIFKSSQPGEAFSLVSLALVRDNYANTSRRVDQRNDFLRKLQDGTTNPQWENRQRMIELELAARTARMHNGDFTRAAVEGNLSKLMADDGKPQGRQYARRFLNAPEYPVAQPVDPMRQQPVGDYFALRCSSELPAAIAKLGIQVTPLKPK